MRQEKKTRGADIQEKTMCDNRGMWLQPKKSSGCHQKVGEMDSRDSFSERTNPAKHFDFRFLASQIVRE